MIPASNAALRASRPSLTAKYLGAELSVLAPSINCKLMAIAQNNENLAPPNCWGELII